MPNQPTIDGTLVRIQELTNLGKLDAAEALCRELLQLAPRNAEVWASLGLVTLLAGRLKEAEAAFHQAVALDTNQANYWTNLSAALYGQGRAAEAEACARRAVALDEPNSRHWVNLGASLSHQQRWEEASQAYREALARDSRYAAAWSNLGAAEQSLDRMDAAQAAYERSLALAPDNLDTKVKYAFLLSQRGQPHSAIELLRNVLSRAPRMATAWLVLGNAYKMLGDLTQAEGAYRAALEILPRFAEARYSLAHILLMQWSLPEAEACVRQLLAEMAHYADAWTLLGAIQQARGQTSEALVALRRSIALNPNVLNHSKLLLALQYADDVSPNQLLEAHRDWDATHARPLRPAKPAMPSHRSRGESLRLGFVSGDFGQHPIGFLALPALESLDKTRSSIVCYSHRLAEDEFTARFRGAADVWRPICGRSDEEVAVQIREDEIDVLFDLMGHAGKRLLVFARQPAPLQVSWLGYVGTTGMSAMDCLLADQFHVRNGEENCYTERVLRMPHGYACYGPPVDTPEVGPLPAQAAGHLTFGCFNDVHKYAPRLLDAWAAILRRVPTARLLLKYTGLHHPDVQNWFRGQFVQRGVDAERILLEGWSPHRELLASYNRIDLALDTHPYSGGLTTCEALWMGVPVVTFPGKTFAGRHSVSHLTNAGYEQFIATDVANYIDLAVHWAGRLDELAAIRLQMRQRVAQSPLCDASRFANDLLATLQVAWNERAATAVRSDSVSST